LLRSNSLLNQILLVLAASLLMTVSAKIQVSFLLGDALKIILAMVTLPWAWKLLGRTPNHSQDTKPTSVE
jgi:F0F1-type ATP synthase assembly protein I